MKGRPFMPAATRTRCVATNVAMPLHLREALEARATKDGTPLAVVVRAALVEHLNVTLPAEAK